MLIIEDGTGFGLYHPIHLHGHDFWVVAQESTVFDPTSPGFTTTNPPRRDVATLPANGYLALAFKLDNPGTWLTHCHIACTFTPDIAISRCLSLPLDTNMTD